MTKITIQNKKFIEVFSIPSQYTDGMIQAVRDEIAQINELYEPITSETYKLTVDDRMRRRGLGAFDGSLDWFPIMDGDIGQTAGYFAMGNFEVEKRKKR